MGAEPPPPQPPQDPNDPLRQYTERARQAAQRSTAAAKDRSQRAWVAMRAWSIRAWEQYQVWDAAFGAWLMAMVASLRARWDERRRPQGRPGDRPRDEARRARTQPLGRDETLERESVDRTEPAPRPERPRRRRRASRGERGTVPGAAVIVARPEDDFGTITGRFETADEVDVVLVVPRGARRLRQPSAWAHLAAHARRRGMVLRVVSPRRDVRAHARANGLRAASRLRQLQHDGFGVTIGGRRIRIPTFKVGGLVKLAVVAGVMGGLVLLVLYRVPSATVTVVPQAETYTTTREVRVSPIVDRSNLEDAVVRAESIREQVTTLITTATTGETEVGEEFATVTLTFINSSSDDVDIAEGTRVSDEEGLIAFLLEEAVEVPAGGTAQGDARAAEPGAQYNVSAGTLEVADLPEDVEVTNGVAATGGLDEIVSAVSQEDVDRVAAIADEVLEEIAQRSLATLLDEGVVFFPETLTTAVFEATPLQQLDEPAEVLLVEYTIVVTAFGLNPATAEEFGAEMIAEDLEELENGLSLLPGTTTTRTLDDLRVEGGQMYVTLEATGMVADMDQFETLTSEITGMQPHEAEALIAEQYDLQGPASIEISPSLVPWRWLPRSESRIDVVFAGPDFSDEDAEDGEDAEDEEDEEGDAEDDGLPDGSEDLEPSLPTPDAAQATAGG